MWFLNAPSNEKKPHETHGCLLGFTSKKTKVKLVKYQNICQPALEKAKQTLEAENADLATELKTAAAARADGERRRKQAEAQLVELAAKLQEVERAR